MVTPFDENMQYAIAYTERRFQFEDGRRNDFILRVACNCNRYGFFKDNVLQYLIKHYTRPDFPASEIASAVDSAYSRYESEFGTWECRKYKNTSNSVAVTSSDRAAALLIPNNYPTVVEQGNTGSTSEFENQLNAFKQLLGKFPNSNDKDIFVTGCFAGILLGNKISAGK